MITTAGGTVVLFFNKSIKYYAGEILHAKGEVIESSEPVSIALNAFVEESYSDGFYTSFFRIRTLILGKIEALIYVLDYPVSALFAGFFLGMRDEIPEEMLTGFHGTGTLHLLALSGLHVGIIFSLIVLIARPLPWRIARWAVGNLFVLFYLFLVGPRPSLVRASLMVLLAGSGVMLDRDTDPLNILGLAFLIILFFDPGSAFTLSFQLSFLALGGILIPGESLSRFLKPYLPDIIRLPISYSIGAQLATFPLILSAFGVYYPIGSLSTILLIPLVTVYIWSGMIFLLLVQIPVPFFYMTIRRILPVLYKGMLLINDFFSQVPGIRMPEIWLFRTPVYLYISAAVGLTAILFFLKKNRSERTS